MRSREDQSSPMMYVLSILSKIKQFPNKSDETTQEGEDSHPPLDAHSLTRERHPITIITCRKMGVPGIFQAMVIHRRSGFATPAC